MRYPYAIGEFRDRNNIWVQNLNEIDQANYVMHEAAD